MYAEKVVIITHSSSGLGKQTVKLFVRRGISKICLIFEKVMEQKKNCVWLKMRQQKSQL